MIDVHCHVLPGIDDGSRSVEMSIDMLHEMKKQGVDKVIATPHFYPMSNSPEKFLTDRQNAYDLLMKEVDDDCPEIVLGAEVMYFEGISRYEGLRDFRAEGTEILLLEMPFIKWTSRAVDEVIRLSASYGIQLLMAHIERYLDYNNKRVLKDFADNGILMQSNAGAVIDRKRRRKVMKLLKNGTVSFVASDAHNTTVRPPNLGEAFEIIEDTLGEDVIDRLLYMQDRYYNRKQRQ